MHQSRLCLTLSKHKVHQKYSSVCRIFSSLLSVWKWHQSRSLVFNMLVERLYKDQGRYNNDDQLSISSCTYAYTGSIVRCLVIFSLLSFPGRTFPNHPYFSAQLGHGQLCLFNVLKAYSVLDEEVGYCQGLSFVAGILLMHMNEQDAFDTLGFLMYTLQVRKQYRPDMQDLQVRTLAEKKIEKWPKSPSLVWDKTMKKGFCKAMFGGERGMCRTRLINKTLDVNLIGCRTVEILKTKLIQTREKWKLVPNSGSLK